MCKRFTWNRNILKQANDFVIKMRLKHIIIKTLQFVCQIIQVRLLTTDWLVEFYTFVLIMKGEIRSAMSHKELISYQHHPQPLKKWMSSQTWKLKSCRINTHLV